MPSFRLRCVPRIAAGVVPSLMLASVAGADISGTVFTIRAENSQGWAEYTALFREDGFSAPGVYDWAMAAPVVLTTAAGQPIATLNAASIGIHEDPDVALNFSVAAGSTTTLFTITSAHVVFGAIGQAEGRATVSVNATDLNDDGVTLSPDGSELIYQTRYNGAAPGGSVFHDFLAAPVTAAFGSASASADFPGGGAFAPIAGEVTDISSRFRFSLTPGDVAGGTSFFRVQPVPGPAGAGMLMVAGLAALRRRRHA